MTSVPVRARNPILPWREAEEVNAKIIQTLLTNNAVSHTHDKTCTFALMYARTNTHIHTDTHRTQTHTAHKHTNTHTGISMYPHAHAPA